MDEKSPSTGFVTVDPLQRLADTPQADLSRNLAEGIVR